MKLLVVARAIDQMAGGVERISVDLMNKMLNRGMEVELLTWDLAESTSFYAMKAEIKWHRLNMGHPEQKASYTLMFQRARVIRNLVRQQNIDVIVCFQAGPFLAMRIYLLGMGIPIIASERNSPSRFEHLKAGWYKSIFFQGFRLAHRITVQCENYRSLYPAYLQDRIITIPNPVYPTPYLSKPDIVDNHVYHLLSVGRLSYQKNYPVLINAFSMIAEEFSAWDLLIIGEGEDKEVLQKLIIEKKMTDRIILIEPTKDINKWYRKSHAFCLSSRWEGFPNALAEALAHGLPAVGFSDCSGVNDLIETGRNGMLAEGNGNPFSLGKALKEIMNDSAKRHKMGQEAITIVDKYDPEKIYDLWENMLFNTVRNQNHTNL